MRDQRRSFQGRARRGAAFHRSCFRKRRSRPRVRAPLVPKPASSSSVCGRFPAHVEQFRHMEKCTVLAEEEVLRGVEERRAAHHAAHQETKMRVGRLILPGVARPVMTGREMVPLRSNGATPRINTTGRPMLRLIGHEQLPPVDRVPLRREFCGH